MSTQTDRYIGQTLRGRNSTYRVCSLLGRGGMANVYLASALDGRDVAIKIPLDGLLDEEEFAARFLREVRSLMKFNHPHALTVLDISVDERAPFVVMPYLAMGSLRLQQPTEGQGQPFPMRPDALLNWLPGIADALDYLHEKGYVHRDVKPENIMFDADGHAFLGDFGIIKVVADQRRDTPPTVATVTGMVLGTPHYMAPEVLIGDRYDGRADQYALACTVYELLAARVPFGGEATMAMVGHATKTPTKISDIIKGFPTAIEDVVLRSLAKQPSDRYPNCRAFAQAFATATRDYPPPRAPSKRPSSGDVNRPSTTSIVCPYCREQAQLPVGVKCRTVCCAKCRKVFSTTESPAKKQADAPTRRQEQAQIETRTDQRRPRTAKPVTRPNPFRLSVFLVLCGVLFGFWFLIGVFGLIVEAQTLGMIAFVLTIPFLFAGIVLGVLMVLRGSSGAITERLRTCEQALVERRYEDALREATQAIELDQRCARAYMQRGFAHAKLRQFLDAHADLSTAIKLDPTLSDAYAARAHVYRQQGDEARAKADEKKANERTRK